MKKIPNLLANQKGIVSNLVFNGDNLIVGDTEKVLNIKNQHLLANEFNEVLNAYKTQSIEKLELACVSVSANTGDGYDDFHYYPLTEIKKKGHNLSDTFKKNSHLPCGFICIHDWANINRQSFDFHNSFYEFTSKEYLVKSINVTSGSICIFPLSNNLNSFKGVNLKPLEEYDEDELKLIQKELDLLKKRKNIKKGEGEIIKCPVENGEYEIFNIYINCNNESYEDEEEESTAVLVLKKQFFQS